jgi:hypothetical protein
MPIHPNYAVPVPPECSHEGARFFGLKAILRNPADDKMEPILLCNDCRHAYVFECHAVAVKAKEECEALTKKTQLLSKHARNVATLAQK